MALLRDVLRAPRLRARDASPRTPDAVKTSVFVSLEDASSEAPVGPLRRAVLDDRAAEVMTATLESMLGKGLEANLVDGACAHLLGDTPARPEDARKNPSVSKDWSELALEETRVEDAFRAACAAGQLAVLEELRLTKQSLVALDSRAGAVRQVLLDTLDDDDDLQLGGSTLILGRPEI